jgi:AraC-like DNA-binding protein
MLTIADRSLQLRVNQCGRVRCEPGWRLAPDWAQGLQDFDLWFVWAGRGLMQCSDEEVPLAPGTCFWMRPGRRYEATQDPAARLGVSYVHFELLTARGRRLPLSDFIPPVEAVVVRHFTFFDVTMSRLIEARREPGGPAVAIGLLASLLVDLIALPPQAEAGIERHHREAILQATARIRESPGASPGVADLARQTGYSVDHFSRVFRRVTGRRPQAYIIEAKLDRARQLLAESALTVGQIAEALGYRDIFFFSRQFREHAGCAPSAYRRGLRSS